MSALKKQPGILLVNPWIYDFSAYDFRQKPLGLLYIGAILNHLGYRTALLDCLDRYHPAWPEAAAAGKTDERQEGAGKYWREELPKPAALAEIPRRYCRYGAPRAGVEAWLRDQPPPEVILMTSFMTYWYPAVADMAALLREIFPRAVLVLGGIYATLCPEHARRTVQPDYLLEGEGEVAAVRLVARLCDGPGADFSYRTLDELPFPWFAGYPRLASIALLTSRGCPCHCSYCASSVLTDHYRRRSPENVFAEVQHWQEGYGVRQFAFFDDALLHHPARYAKPLFRLLARAGEKLALHTPNGVHLRCIDDELADLLYTAGMKSLRLSYESSSPRRRQGKVTPRELESALARLHRAGFGTAELGVYLLAGVPGQPIREVRASAQRVHDLGARVYLASYSPIPGTVEYETGVACGEWDPGADLLLTNNSLFPLWRKRHTPEELAELSLNIKQLNQSLLSSDEE